MENQAHLTCFTGPIMVREAVTLRKPTALMGARAIISDSQPSMPKILTPTFKPFIANKDHKPLQALGFVPVGSTNRLKGFLSMNDLKLISEDRLTEKAVVDLSVEEDVEESKHLTTNEDAAASIDLIDLTVELKIASDRDFNIPVKLPSLHPKPQNVISPVATYSKELLQKSQVEPVVQKLSTACLFETKEVKWPGGIPPPLYHIIKSQARIGKRKPQPKSQLVNADVRAPQATIPKPVSADCSFSKTAKSESTQQYIPPLYDIIKGHGRFEGNDRSQILSSSTYHRKSGKQ